MANPDSTRIDIQKPLAKSGWLTSLLLNVLDVRVWLLFLCLAVVFYQGRLPSLSWLDDAFFHAGLFFKTEPLHIADPLIITFDKKILNELNRDPDHCEELFDVLKKLKYASPAAVALILDYPPLYGSDGTVLAIRDNIRALEQAAMPPLKKDVGRVLSMAESALIRGSKLAYHLDQTDVILALKIPESGVSPVIIPGSFGSSSGLSVKPNPGGSYLDHFPESAFPSHMPRLIPYTEQEMWTGPVAPLASDTSGSNWPLVWQEQDRVLPDLVSLMFAYTLKTRPVWEDGNSVVFGYAPVPTDPRGYVKIRYGEDGGFKGKILRRSSKDIRAAKDMNFVKKRPVFLGSSGDPSLTMAALAYLSLSSGALSHEPYQAIWTSKILVLGLFVYLVLILPLFRTGPGLMVSLVLIFSMVICQMAYHLITDQFLPLSHALIFLVIGHGAVTIRQAVKKRYVSLENLAQSALYELGSFQYDQSRLNKAFDTLKKCHADKNVLELLYKLAVSLERKRQFDKARDVFEHIMHMKPSYRDVRERVDQLSQFVFGRTQAGSGSGSPTSNLSRSVLGRYELERELGRGAMGVVYLGQDPKIGRLIAIKTMDFTQTFEGHFDEVKDRFFREAMAAGRLNHPNIVTIYDAGEEQDLAYIAMDYVEGSPLNEFSRPDTLLPVNVVFHIMAQVADALDYAHSQKIIHRDIKPGNIIYNPETHAVKVTDFGIARIADTTITRPGVVVGSPSFMSPEQLKGKVIDGRADIFSLGVTFYQLLTGTLPFKGDDLASLAYQITQGKHEQVGRLRKDLPKIADSIIDKALQKNPEKRYKSAAGMARSLRTVLNKGLPE